MISPETAERKRQNLTATFDRRPHERVPLMGRLGTAVLDYYGYTYSELQDDPDRLTSVMCGFFDELPSDCLSSGSLFLSLDMSDLLGENLQTRLAADGITLQHQQKPLMKPEDYPLAIADVRDFENNVLLRRKFPFLFENGVREAAKVLEAVCDRRRAGMAGSAAGLTARLEQEYGQTVFGDRRYMCTTPGDVIFDEYRGFVGTLTDLRRHYAEMKDLCEVLWNEGYAPDFAKMPLSPGKFPLYMSHIPCFLSPSQYEDLCFRYFKRQIEGAAAQGSKIYILAEGSWAHLFDFFLDVPQDSVLMNVENDDVWDAYAKIGARQILLGGARLANTKLRSLEENIAYAKKAIDTCAPGNAFIFCTDKAWCCKGDITKTLIDVFRFAETYGRY